MFYVVSYDIRNDKRRNKVAKQLLDYGNRVQFSVFECNLDNQQAEKMRMRLQTLIKSEEDTIRIYQICEACRSKIKIYGTGKISEDVDLYII